MMDDKQQQASKYKGIMCNMQYPSQNLDNIWGKTEKLESENCTNHFDALPVADPDGNASPTGIQQFLMQ